MIVNTTLSPTVPSSGADVATLNPIPQVPVGNSDRIAPLGTIDAGEAGIRVSVNPRSKPRCRRRSALGAKRTLITKSLPVSALRKVTARDTHTRWRGLHIELADCTVSVDTKAWCNSG